MNKNVRQFLLPMIVSFIWGSAFLVQGSVASKIGAFSFNAVRAFVAAIVLFPVSLLIDKRRIARGIQYKNADKKRLLLGGSLCGIAVFAASNLQQYGIYGSTEAGGQVLTEGDAAFITSLYIVLVPLVLVFFNRKPSVRIWVSIALALVALMLICNFSGGAKFTKYHLELFCSAIVYTVHILLVDKFVKNQDGLKLSFVQFAVMGVLSAVCALIFEEISVEAIGDSILQILYVGVFSCAIGYTLQNVAQKGTNPTVVSVILSLESFFALLCEVVIGLISGNPIRHTPLQFIGCFIMIVAIVISQFDPFGYIRSRLKNKRG